MARFLSVLVAFFWLSQNSDASDIFRDHIRTPENMAIAQGYYPYPQQQQNYATTPVFAPVPTYSPAAYSPAPPSPVRAVIPTAGLDDSDVDVRISQLIARNVLNFGHNLGQQLSTSYRKTEIFSPLSVMSALALLLLGSKGSSHEELARIFSLYDSELQRQPEKLHEQLGLLLRDVQQPSLATISPQRTLDPWRNSRTGGSMRGNRRTANNRPIQHTINIANGLFTQLGYTLNPDYSQVITSVYGSVLKPLDFARSPAQARFAINDWVEQQTLGKIPNIIAGDVAPSTRVIMASALYFKAFWEQDFIETATRLDNFYPNGDAQPPIKVEMMATGGAYPYYEDEQLGCRIIGLPYRGNMTTMYVIQPLKSTVASLQQLQQSLDADRIELLISKMVRRTALLAFPKLHVTESINMKDMLKRMNINSIFSRLGSDLSLIGTDQPTEERPYNIDVRNMARSANKARISLQNLEAQRSVPSNGQSQSQLYVEDIVHKVDFVVNEQGTEAAAATVTYLNKSGPDVLFRADAPFMVLVRHDPTKLVLFYGVINEPPAANAH